ncbi:MAG: type II toxin-antitoxin system VapC family toxin [Candidatus Bipolaricaulota bacterium]
MKFLLDTHVFLWWVIADPRLSRKARGVIADGGNTLYLSAASGWEIAVKAGLSRLQVADELERLVPEQMDLNGIEGLPVAVAHALRVHALPAHHRDPFDLLLVAKAELEDLAIVTGDPQIAEYGVRTVW